MMLAGIPGRPDFVCELADLVDELA